MMEKRMSARIFLAVSLLAAAASPAWGQCGGGQGRGMSPGMGSMSMTSMQPSPQSLYLAMMQQQYLQRQYQQQAYAQQVYRQQLENAALAQKVAKEESRQKAKALADARRAAKATQRQADSQTRSGEERRVAMTFSP